MCTVDSTAPRPARSLPGVRSRHNVAATVGRAKSPRRLGSLCSFPSELSCELKQALPRTESRAERPTRSVPLASFRGARRCATMGEPPSASHLTRRHATASASTSRHAHVEQHSTFGDSAPVRAARRRLKARTAPCTPYRADTPSTPQGVDSRASRGIQWTPLADESPPSCQSSERGFFFPFCLAGSSRDSTPEGRKLSNDKCASEQVDLLQSAQNGVRDETDEEWTVMPPLPSTISANSSTPSSTTIEGIADAALEKTAGLLRMLEQIDVEHKDDLTSSFDCDGNSTSCPESIGRSVASLSGDAASEDGSEDAPFLSGMGWLVATLEQRISSLEERFTSMPGHRVSTGLRARSKSRSRASVQTL